VSLVTNTNAPRPPLPHLARQMAQAANRFLEALGAKQVKAARYAFDDDRRFVWDYRPPEVTRRNGLRLINMTRDQQALAMRLLDTGLSARGADQARRIMAQETILREVERAEGDVNFYVRDPEAYAFAIFGEPGGTAPWAWQVGGHHIGLHFTLVGDGLIGAVPLFLGSRPAVMHDGTRILAEEEELPRALLRSLDSGQRAEAIVSATAPDDLLSDRFRYANPFTPPSGLAFAQMSGEQRDQLVRVVRHHIERATDEVSGTEWRAIEDGGLDAITFAWAGGEESGQGHYYAIKGPTFLVEYDNTQQGANHIHSVWRDFTNDWGGDLLAAHYRAAHRRGHSA
jgi:hypothetical protein